VREKKERKESEKVVECVGQNCPFIINKKKPHGRV